MEEEPRVTRSQEEEEQKNTKRSQRPPKPLTHRMDRRALLEAYYKAGLFRPELSKKPRARSDKTNTRTVPSKEKLMNDNTGTQTGPSPKPGVGGTHQARSHGEVSTMQNALIYGGTAFGVGTMLMLTWKGLTRWLG